MRLPAVGRPSLPRRRELSRPSSWPVRWRLAGVSAALTFVILLMFAVVVGGLAKDRLENDFRNDLLATANEVAFQVEFDDAGQPVPLIRDAPALGDVVIRISNSGGYDRQSEAGAEFPEPKPGEVIRSGELDVASVQVATNQVPSFTFPTFVQVARNHSDLDATIGRLWFFLAIGVGGGTILATLAGLAVAGRAMRPISALTSTAREIASTRDPARTMPKPRADDEIAELANTLDDMLRELDAARNEAEHMVQVQREFVADASHELRTPLTSILANLELLQHSIESAPEPDSDDAETVESALRSSRRMRRLVADLLLLARADAGRSTARKPCSLGEIAKAAVAEVRPVAGEHRIELATEPVVVEGSADELHRLVVNLIDNGVRHTPGDTTIRVSVTERGEDAVLEVSDDGPGVPDGLEEQIFSRFVRGTGPADLVKDSGTGLGLSIVRAVAESHGGSVLAASSAAGGARFTVTLPASKAPLESNSKLSRIL